MHHRLLDVSSIEAGGQSLRRRPEDPVLVISRALHLFEELATEHGIALVLRLPEHLPTVNVDADRIIQALGNLIANAIKFTPSGGEIRIRAEVCGDKLQCAVIDGGPGIPTDDMPHIFDRFWTARRTARTRGPGMGLAILRGIVNGHGGEVWAEAAPGGTGAMFVVSLPMT